MNTPYAEVLGRLMTKSGKSLSGESETDKRKLKYHFSFTKQTQLYFRIILTGECNNNCIYCFKEADVGSSGGKFTCSFFDELIRVAEKYKIPKIHFTGGEPLLEGDLIGFIRKIKNQSSLDVGLTTNGTLLKFYARKLYEVGLRRINVSLPTLDSLKYRTICKQDVLKKVLQNIDDLISLKFNPVKINIPIFRQNVSEINNFLTYFLQRDAVVLRFFSVLPNPGLKSEDCLTNDETIGILEREILSLPKPLKKESIKRVFYRAPSQPSLGICQNCTRRTICQDQAKAIRVSGDGKFSLCLLNPEYSFQMKAIGEIEEGVKKLLSYYN